MDAGHLSRPPATLKQKCARARNWMLLRLVNAAGVLSACQPLVDRASREDAVLARNAIDRILKRARQKEW